MDDYKHTHIPAFGNWDYEDGLPITQYFESARQAGLFRYNHGEGDLYAYTGFYEEDKDLYLKPANTIAVLPCTKIKEGVEREYPCKGRARAAPKAVDEDLYKIPPEMIYSTNPKKRKMFGFFTRCLVPSCVV